MVVNLPEGPVEGFDRFGVQVFNGLFIAPAHAVVGACVAVEGVDCFGDTHLGGRHCWSMVNAWKRRFREE